MKNETQDISEVGETVAVSEDAGGGSSSETQGEAAAAKARQKENTGPDAPTTLNVAGATPEIYPDDITDDLQISLGEFEGPLDLLLHLIRQEQISIYDIPIARITNEYLRYLNLMQELDLTMAGDFLVMAAQIIEFKSRMVLPRDRSASTAVPL